VKFADLHAFATFVRDELPGRIAAGKRTGLRAGGAIILGEMVGEIGAYQKGDPGFDDMVPLARGTLEGWDAFGGRLEGKIERGLASPGQDNPLKANGALEASFGQTGAGDIEIVGSTSPNAVWQNDGTSARGEPFLKGATVEPGVPGREFIGRAAYRTSAKAVAAIGAAILEEMADP
jgi:hypothetical protein